MKDPAFQSQQFAEQVAQRKQRSLEIQGNAGFQAGEMFLRSMQTASTVASQQVERQQAIEELAWARELHSADMLELQKDMLGLQKKGLAAQVDLAIAKAKRESEGLVDYPMGIDEDQRDALLSQGIDMSFRGGRPVAVEATEDRKSEGLSRLEQRRAQKYMAGLTEAQIRAEATIQAAGQRGAYGGSGRDYDTPAAADIATNLLKSATAEYSAARDHGTPEERKAALEKVQRYQTDLDNIQSKTMEKAGIEREKPVMTREQARQQMNRDILNAVNQHLGVTK